MEDRAERLAEWAEHRIGGGLRVVGYHTDDDYDLTYLRDDLDDGYTATDRANLIGTIRELNGDVQEFDTRLGTARESLYVLETSLVAQFHFQGEGAVFMSVDFDVGRNFVSFIEECRHQMT